MREPNKPMTYSWYCFYTLHLPFRFICLFRNVIALLVGISIPHTPQHLYNRTACDAGRMISINIVIGWSNEAYVRNVLQPIRLFSSLLSYRVRFIWEAMINFIYYADTRMWIKLHAAWLSWAVDKHGVYRLECRFQCYGKASRKRAPHRCFFTSASLFRLLDALYQYYSILRVCFWIFLERLFIDRRFLAPSGISL